MNKSLLTEKKIILLIRRGLDKHSGESRDFRGFKNNRFLSNPLDSGKTLVDISVNTDQIGMGLKQIPWENVSNMYILIWYVNTSTCRGC